MELIIWTAETYHLNSCKPGYTDSSFMSKRNSQASHELLEGTINSENLDNSKRLFRIPRFVFDYSVGANGLLDWEKLKGLRLWFNRQSLELFKNTIKNDGEWRGSWRHRLNVKQLSSFESWEDLLVWISGTWIPSWLPLQQHIVLWMTLSEKISFGSQRHCNTDYWGFHSEIFHCSEIIL